jgi:hypothetical protein
MATASDTPIKSANRLEERHFVVDGAIKSRVGLAAGAVIILEEAVLCAAARMGEDPEAAPPCRSFAAMNSPSRLCSPLFSLDVFRDSAGLLRRPAEILPTDALADPCEASDDPLVRELSAG